jgi:hypothetical protein
MDKSILLASFIFPERLDWFVSYLNTKFNIPKDKVFCYKNTEDESKLIVIVIASLVVIKIIVRIRTVSIYLFNFSLLKIK